MLSLSEGTNPPSQAEEEENQPLITHFSARFHSKTRQLFGKTRREIFQIRRLLLHFLPVSSSKPSKIGFNSRENRFSIPLAPQFFLFSSFRVSAKKGDLVHFVREREGFLKKPLSPAKFKTETEANQIKSLLLYFK